MKEKIKVVLFSYDTISALIASVIVWIFLPFKIRADFSITFYNVGISVLSIIFSLFFTALAIIMSSSDNEFIEFMEEDGHYSFLMYTFKVTLTGLFLSLVYSIILMLYVDYILKHSKNPDLMITKYPFILFVGLFSYSLVAALLSVKDTISFSKYRLIYLQNLKRKRESEKTNCKK